MIKLCNSGVGAVRGGLLGPSALLSGVRPPPTGPSVKTYKPRTKQLKREIKDRENLLKCH